MTTVVVLDMAHCGTTMLAGVLERLGVPMTQGGDRGFLEDAALAESLRNREAFEALVQERSGQTWGFKHNGVWRFAKWFGCLDNPVYLAIYKDPVSVTRRYHGDVEIGALYNILLKMDRSMAGIAASNLSVHWLSYLEAVRGPHLFAERIAEICGLSATEKQIHRAASHITLRGCLDG